MWIYRNADNSIHSIAENDVLTLAEGQSKEELTEVSLADFAGRFLLSASSPTVQVSDYDAPDIHEVVVQVSTNLENVSVLDVAVNGDVQQVTLINGVGQLEPISSEVLGQISIEPADKASYWGRLSIQVVDNE